MLFRGSPHDFSAVLMLYNIKGGISVYPDAVRYDSYNSDM